MNVVLVTAPLDPDRLRTACSTARARGARVGIVPAGPGPRRLPAAWRTDVAGRDVLVLPVGGGVPRSRRLGRAFDVGAAALLAVLTAPVWLLAAAAIRADSPGPVLFAQERVGRDGRRFRIWKFRTMRADAPPYARSPGDADPAVTRVGRLLRPAGLDELPQLYNVLRGEMRLVGPRPEMPFIVDRYTPLERERLRATPGITGLWQLCGDRSRPMHEQLEYDLAYAACASAALDARILVGTAARALRALTGA
ncbi:hypothetical protein tb265_15920 [Gemmatimonadetes bacterium T265]|nr:hypothetical protein tb265_15920 [Gemmatimonadetes bacterium T265]